MTDVLRLNTKEKANTILARWNGAAVRLTDVDFEQLGTKPKVGDVFQLNVRTEDGEILGCTAECISRDPLMLSTAAGMTNTSVFKLDNLRIIEQ